MKKFQLFNQFVCVSPVTEFSKEQNKLSISTVHHKHYCYRNFSGRFAVKLLSKIAVICRNYTHSRMRDFFKFNFTFHNTLIFNRTTFNSRVVCCVDFITECWQSVEDSFKELRKISVLKIPTNRKT